MPKVAEDLTKHTLMLYSGDYEKLRELYPDHGAAVIIRRIVRAHLRQIETRGEEMPSAKVEIGL